MHIPAFSLFSAVSELFVTAGVVYVVRRGWTRRPFSLAIFLAVALFEAFVNVLYMASRAAQASAPGAAPLPTALKVLYASHGILSLLVYLVFVLLGVFAWQDQRRGRYFFRDRPVVTWTFLFFWTVSIVSGEYIFFRHYFG